MKILIELIPEEFQRTYNLLPLVKNGNIYMQIERGIYGLPQSGILFNKLLQKRLAPYGYYEMPHSSGLWKHTSRPISFTLVIDNFGIKYVGK